jgi:hypothetical protein
LLTATFCRWSEKKVECESEGPLDDTSTLGESLQKELAVSVDEKDPLARVVSAGQMTDHQLFISMTQSMIGV